MRLVNINMVEGRWWGWST